jgi:uncharacterized protein YegL
MRGDRVLLILTICVLMIVGSLYRVPRTFALQGEDLNPSSISVKGEIVDNYANVTYEILFDNTGSAVDKEVDWYFELQDEIRLSNISVKVGDEMYWGRAMRESQAVITYTQAVESNLTAALVMKEYDGYRICFNAKAEEEARMDVFVEGLLTRDLGIYSLILPISTGGIISGDFALDLSIISHYEPVAGYSVSGISSFDVVDLPNGIRIQHSLSGTTIPDELVVKYALDRQTGGSQLLTFGNGTENFFVYALAPSITEVSERAYRQYIFVLDRSGSMGGTKMSQAKTAFSSMVEQLGSNDLFNIIAFSTEITQLWVEPHSADSSNIDTAQDWVNGLSAGGSTNFHGACLAGLETFYEGSYAKVMFVLSDGQPTVGVMNSDDIMTAICESNSLGVSISTIAFGSDADETLMANIAAQNNGYFTFIEPSRGASTEMLDFYKRFSTPVASSYSIQIDGDLETTTLHPLGDSPFFNGSEVIITGRYSASLSIQTDIEYVTGIETYQNSATTPSTNNQYVEYIWAQHRIMFLLRQVSLEGFSETLRDQITSIALTYGLIVDGYTAIVLVAEEPEDHTTEPEPTTNPTDTPGTTYTYTETTGTNTATAASIDPLMSGLFGGVVVGGLVVCVFFAWAYSKRR